MRFFDDSRILMFMRRELAMNRLRDMDTGFGVHVYRKPDLALVLRGNGTKGSTAPCRAW